MTGIYANEVEAVIDKIVKHIRYLMIKRNYFFETKTELGDEYVKWSIILYSKWLVHFFFQVKY